MQIKGRGILLRATKYGESDLILQLLSSQGEKQTLIAKGALKSKKRFGGGVLQPTHFIEFAAKKTNSEFLIVEEASLINGFEKIRSDFDRLETAFFLVEIILKISQEGDAFGVSLFDLLGNALKALESAESLDHLKLQFGLKVLHQQGVLEPENWMKPYLSISLLEQKKLFEIGSLDTRVQLIWLENRIKEYMTTGML